MNNKRAPIEPAFEDIQAKQLTIQRVQSMKIRLYIAAMLAFSYGAFADEISTSEILNIYGTPEQLLDLFSLRHNDMESNEVRVWQIYMNVDILSEDFCPECMEVNPLPVPQPPPTPCNKQSSTSREMNSFSGTLLDLKSFINQKFTQHTQRKILVQMMDVNSINESAHYMNKNCGECIDVDPLPDPDPCK